MTAVEDKGKWAFDIEANGFLDDSTVDYTTSPWTLKKEFKIHCICATNVDTGEEVDFVQEECYKLFPQWVEDNVEQIIAHNGIAYDLLVLKVALKMHYTIGPDTLMGKPIIIDDTYVLSKVLNPDRKGHSVEFFGKEMGEEEKIDWRAEAISLGLINEYDPKGAEFRVYHPQMLVYCRRDTNLLVKIYKYLMKEWGDWNWTEAYELEKHVAWIIVRQSHRGFQFNEDLAIKNVKELDELMEERRKIVEPNLPPKPMGKTKLKDYIPGAKQFKLDGTPNANIIKWCAKHGGEIQEREDGYYVSLYEKEYKLPIPQDPIVTTEPSEIKDTTFIKGVLVEMGWKPENYKERDLTVNTFKQKLSKEKFAETVERYVTQTLASPFCSDRCEKLNVTPARLRDKLLSHDMSKPLKVYTNPSFTVGQEKQIDPNLEQMSDEFPYVKYIVEYLTYNHRRNSILGGGFDPDDLDDEEEAEKGFLANVRADGRIPTPADTCGAATGRMKHKIVCNIPRVTSLYGEPMRSLFSADEEGNKHSVQYAYDFASLEGREEGHYCWRYDEDKVYSLSLIQEKPNDVHTLTAKKVSELIGQAFGRQPAKNVKYACTYGAQAARVAKTIGSTIAVGQMVFDAFWEAALPLAQLRDKLTHYWETVGQKKFILGIDGRKIMTRSKHALLNSLFQSAGVICAKYVMVQQDKKFTEHGLNVDFWVDDWKNKQYVQQLIAMHDECQFEVTRGLIKWKMFKTEEEAKEFKASNPKWVGPGHNEKGYFMAYSLVNDLVQEAVEDTNKHYKLNVPLAVEPQFGRNWAECH